MTKRTKTPNRADTAENDAVADPEINRDVMPEPDDDTDPAPIATAETPAEEERKEEPPARPEVESDDRRAAIAQRYRALRHQQNAEGDEGDTDADAAQESEASDSGHGDEGAEPDEGGGDAGQAEPEIQAAPAEIELTIDGQKVKKPLSEIIALAQINGAADKRLEESKRLYQEAKTLLESAKADRGQTSEHRPGETGENAEPDRSQAGPQPEHRPAVQSIDQDKLKSIVERIQVGDEDEGAAALNDLIEFVRGEVTSSGRTGQAGTEEVSRLVTQALDQAQTQQEIRSALGRFAEQYTDIANDEVLSDAALTVLRNEMISDLKTVGVTDEDILPIRRDTRSLAEAHRRLRIGGHEVRSYDKLLADVGSTMSEKFGIRPAEPGTRTRSESQAQQQRPMADPGKIQERIDRKRAAPQQPRPAGVRGQVQQAPRPKTRKEIVAEQRRARGFAPLS